MLDFHHFVCHTSNDDAGGVANEALIDFDFALSSPLTVDELAARVIGYIGGYAASTGAAGTVINKLTYRTNLIPGSVDVSFPGTEYTALRVIFPGLPAYSGYGEAFGTGALTPIGTSAQIREFTANPGRSGKGRHYLPFVGADYISSAGQLTSGAQTELVSNYALLMLEFGHPAMGAAAPIVYSRKFDLVQPILNVTASPTCSNLRTRRR